MTKSELEKKHLSDLHLLAAEAGIEKYRLLTKAELAERLAEGNGDGGAAEPPADQERKERPRRRREPRERPEKAPEPAPESERERESAPESPSEPAAEAPEAASGSQRPRRRRRRRFGRRGKQDVTLQTLLLPPEAGRQALLFAETREGCTALLRGVAADLSADAKGPDPVALLIDPSPEELADWKRDAPQAEIVSAGQPRHASDALAQAAARAGRGEDVILLVDSLTRLAEASGEAEAAKELFDAGRTQGDQGGGSLTVVAALERPS
ncbi:MAG TPA: Rho termination factor N-terminal domain-containing protein [Solirubrobacterales bacterium]|nr:Rho termination factor N-terminal domain-containing protein [Solirubrobacterales bacterium]